MGKRGKLVMHVRPSRRSAPNVGGHYSATGGKVVSSRHVIPQMRPLHPLFGVEVDGLNLVSMTAAESAAALSKLVARYRLVVVKDQVLSPRLHVEIARSIGPVEVHGSEASQL